MPQDRMMPLMDAPITSHEEAMRLYPDKMPVGDMPRGFYEDGDVYNTPDMSSREMDRQRGMLAPLSPQFQGGDAIPPQPMPQPMPYEPTPMPQQAPQMPPYEEEMMRM